MCFKDRTYWLFFFHYRVCRVFSSHGSCGGEVSIILVCSIVLAYVECGSEVGKWFLVHSRAATLLTFVRSVRYWVMAIIRCWWFSDIVGMSSRCFIRFGSCVFWAGFTILPMPIGILGGMLLPAMLSDFCFLAVFHTFVELLSLVFVELPAFLLGGPAVRMPQVDRLGVRNIAFSGAHVGQ